MVSPARSSAPRLMFITTPDGRTRTVKLDHSPITLGRSSAADLAYADDAGLSRQHLSIAKEGDNWVLSDLGSKNGTMLNGARISEKQPLKAGDRVTAGHLV